MRRLCRGTQFQIPFLLPSATCSNMVFYDPLKLGQLSVMRTEPKWSRCKWLVQSEKIALFFGTSPKHQCFFWKWFQSQDLLGKPVLRSYAHDSATFYACNIAMQNWSKFKDPDPYIYRHCVDITLLASKFPSALSQLRIQESWNGRTFLVRGNLLKHVLPTLYLNCMRSEVLSYMIYNYPVKIIKIRNVFFLAPCSGAIQQLPLQETTLDVEKKHLGKAWPVYVDHMQLMRFIHIYYYINILWSWYNVAIYNQSQNHSQDAKSWDHRSMELCSHLFGSPEQECY